MLKREQAQAQLESFRIKDWRARREQELAGLASELEKMGLAILDWRSPDHETALTQVADLSATDRLQLFNVLFPQFGDSACLAYDLLLELPYQHSYCRRSFRSRNPQHHQAQRDHWLYTLLNNSKGFEQPLDWYAAWANYLDYGQSALAIALAAAINQEEELGEKIFAILCDSARGDHDIGAMGRHVSRALLVANRPEGWELMGNMLVAAQRQEGLRQVILETIDEAHPQAFERLLRVLLEEELVRFSATIRAADVWFGLNWDVEQKKQVKSNLSQLLALLEDPEQQTVALVSDDAQWVFLALWQLGFRDVAGAIKAAAPLLQDPRPEHRFVAVYLLHQLDIPEARQLLVPCLYDEHRRIAAQAFFALHREQEIGNNTNQRQAALEALLEQFPHKESKLKPLVWPWMKASIRQADISDEMVRHWDEDTSIEPLIQYLPQMSYWGKNQMAVRLIQAQPWSEQAQTAIVDLLKDRSSDVRQTVFTELQKSEYAPQPGEAEVLEQLLVRKASDLRRGILQLLLKQEDEATIASAQRLMAATKAPQRLAGLELLDQLQQMERIEVRPLAEAYVAERAKPSASEQELLDRLLADQQDVPSLDDALGLAPPEQLTPIISPEAPPQSIALKTDAAQALLKGLDELIEAQRTAPIEVELWNGNTESELLGNLHWLPHLKEDLSREENLARLPLAEVWCQWWEERPAELRDEDGFELLRVSVAFTRGESRYFSYGYHHFSDDDEEQIPAWIEGLTEADCLDLKQLKYLNLIHALVNWLMYLYKPEDMGNGLCTAAQQQFSQVLAAAQASAIDWRQHQVMQWFTAARNDYRQGAEAWSKEQIAVFWRSLCWLDRPDTNTLPRWRKVQGQYGYSYEMTHDHNGHIARIKPSLHETWIAFQAGAATQADLADCLLGQPETQGRFHELAQLTRRKPDPLIKQWPQLASLVNQCRERILAIELARGELSTAATAPARNLASIAGIATLMRLLQNFDTEKFVRGWSYNNESKAAVFSHLCRVSFPGPGETPADFAAQAKAADIPEQRLVEVAVYAPQWASYVEVALGWTDFAEAVWWFHAHTKDNNWQVEQEIRDLWTAQIAELTPLSSQDLVDGAVDVNWFHRIHRQLKPKQWAMLDEAAKYASGGGGHKRAQLFAEAMTGKADREALLKRALVKRYQDAVRALGLLPLAKGKQREKDLLERYQSIQEFLRTSRKFGSQRRASEKLACRIAMDNLARTAGYPDPQRLEWAMEGMAIADLAQGPVTVSVDEVSVSLSLSEIGHPELKIIKTDKKGKSKTLKNIPAKLKKNEAIQTLKERKQKLVQQASRMRQSLEEAMCRGDEFTGAELKQLLEHPILRPLLTQLVFMEVKQQTLGYLSEQGIASHDETVISLKAKGRYRLAHSFDLAQSQSWHLWQAHCFKQEQVQPFKQIFRELYLQIPSEQQEKWPGSSRYAGHQVNPRQAIALLGQRGWVAHPEEGVRRTFHDENVNVWVEFEEGWYSPTEVEGLTLNQVCFSDRKTGKVMALEKVPPLVFSEVMRDLDLVVSVAHQGGVDPEASHSTVEMRAALLRETCRLLKLENITLQDPHALIEGQLGSYSLHLGSANVHRQPGGALCIVPVHSQHRGRLFLPFADDDPRTAEVISKALLLAKDKEIQDPTILEQLL